jgi:hypothetical protein
MGFLSNLWGNQPVAAPPPPAPAPAPSGGLFGSSFGANAPAPPPSLYTTIAGQEDGNGNIIEHSGYTIPNWLKDQGATYLPGGGFGGNTSFLLGDNVYTGQYSSGNPDGGIGGSYVGDMYKYKYGDEAKQGFAGFGSALNGTDYEKLDQMGNVTGSGKWEGISDKGHLGELVVALVGAALGGVAMSGAGAAGSAAAGAGEGAAALGAGEAAAGAGGTFGAGGLGTGSLTGGSYGLGTTLGGAAGSTYGGAAIGSGLGTAGALGAGAAGAAGAGSAAAGGSTLSSLMSNPLFKTALTSILGGAGGGGGGGNGSNMTQGNGTGGGGAGGLAPWLIGLNDAYQQNNAGDKMLQWMNGQQAKVDNLYNPGTAEYNALWDEMSRKDAAAGRNSQYGPRSVDLAGRIAQIKADNTTRMTTGLARGYSDALTQKANGLSIPGIASILGGQSQGGGANTVQNLTSLLGLLGGGGDNGSFWGMGNPSYDDSPTASNEDIWNQINGGDYDFSEWWN